MHEFSIASEIVSNVLDATKKNDGRKVLAVQLEIGELTLLNIAQVTFWVKELFKDSIAEGAKVKARAVKARIVCEECGYKGRVRLSQEDLVSRLGLQNCPQCHSFQVKVEKGKECLLRRIQVSR